MKVKTYSFAENLFNRLVSFNLRANGINTELNETLGCPDEVYSFSNIFIKAVADQINKCVREKKSDTVTYTENDIDISAANVTFFKKFNITIKTDYDTNFIDDSRNSARFNIEKSKFIRQNDGTYIMFPVININVTSVYPSTFAELIFLEIGHELTHCYSLYRTFLHNLNIYINDDGKKVEGITRLFREYNTNEISCAKILQEYPVDHMTKYNTNHINRQTKDENSFGGYLNTFIFLTSKPELNATVSQLRNELDKFRFKTGKDALAAIKQTKAYEKLEHVLYCKNMLTYILSNDDIMELVFNDDIAIQLEEETGKKFQDPKSAIIYINDVAFDYQDAFMKKATRMASFLIDINESGFRDEFIMDGRPSSYLHDRMWKMFKTNKI